MNAFPALLVHRTDLVRRMPSARGNEWAQKGLFALAVLYTAYFAKAVLLPLVLAVLLTLWLAPVVRAMKRSWLPEPVGAAILVLALAAMSVCAVYLFCSTPASAGSKARPRCCARPSSSCAASRGRCSR